MIKYDRATSLNSEKSEIFFWKSWSKSIFFEKDMKNKIKKNF